MRQGKGLLAAAGANAGEDYVTDGLVLYYDAGKTASYPGTGTTWTDLVSNTTATIQTGACLLYTSPSPRDGLLSRMPSSA